MTTVGTRDGEVKDLAGGMCGEQAAVGSGADPGGRGLVLPDEVVANLAGQLVARARAGEPVRLTGAGGLLSGVIGQVLQAGLALELEEHLAAGGEGGNGRNGYRAKTVKTEAWAQAFAQMRNRGLEDVIICCCDGLAGLGEEITATWPAATVQSCVVHLIRAAARYGSSNDRKALCAAMRPVYAAPDMDAAEAALLEFSDSPLGRKYPAAVSVWERAWDRFVPFLEFAPPIRKVIYTTNTIESFNRQMRKIIKTRGHFPDDDALVKLLWLGIVDIEDKRAAERARQAARRKNQRNAPGHLIEGAMTQGWREALAAFDGKWPGRIPVTAM